MRPTLEARGLKASLLQYLSTTYALADEGVRLALEDFLGNETSGMFRGPFLRVRTPFRQAADGWEAALDWVPDGFQPYAHQALAFARLTSRNHDPEPTLVTTGTGSGKTESFLLPILDHCRRARIDGRAADGVKAILLYPMNALATDQAMRLNDYLGRDELKSVTAGLYIGDRAAAKYERVLTSRSDIRRTPPDLLITNYKMLDLLLQRGDDAPLWRDAAIQYVVVDEFHTYDGAQGTDVAMLLRRLASRVGAAVPGRPLGSICPVATSATLAGAGGMRDLLRVAGQVFGTEFTESAVIGEQRTTVDEFIKPDLMQGLNPPTPEEIVALPDPARDPQALLALARSVVGDECLTSDGELDRFALGALLRQRMLTYAVMMALGGDVKAYDAVLAEAWRHGAQSWSRAVVQDPELAAEALARFVALLSEARDPESDRARPRPLVHVEVHQWARSVTRLLRGVLPWPHAEFRWDALDAADAHSVDVDRNAPSTTAGSGVRANLFLPAVYCRDCGRSGWAVYTPESDDLSVDVNPMKIRRASAGRDKIRVRNLIAATGEETRAGRAVPDAPRGRDAVGAILMVLDGVNQRLRPVDQLNDYDAASGEPRLRARDSAFVLVHLGPTANTAGNEDWCPACGSRNAIRYLGTGLAALAAASVTQLFTGNELRAPDPAAAESGERKTLMFCDSVQDAAHRAGFVASRSYTFSLRALLAAHLSAAEPTRLNDLIANVVESTDATTEQGRRTLAAVVPPDLHDHQGVARLLSGRGRGGDQETWRLIGERLTFASVLEFGLRARQGRTLELTRTAAAFVEIPDPVRAVAVVRDVLAGLPSAVLGGPAHDDARVLAFLRAFLERLRVRGAIKHRWLETFIADAAVTRRPVWGKRPAGMPAFPSSIPAPTFLLDREKRGSEFDRVDGRLAWYERWAQRCFHIPREQTRVLWAALLPALVDAGLLSARTASDGATRVYGLRPGAISVRLLADGEVNSAYVRCDTCFWEQTVHPVLLSQWDGQPCPGYRCSTGRLIAGTSAERDQHARRRDYRTDYYRRLYLEAGTYQVITAEHTGMLTRPQRERVEAAFRTGANFNDPNVLACTPTLELGIDIGDLSAVVLASLPRTPANYSQRVGRAGRRTGNAYLLTIPDRRRRDLYFLEQPREMIAGEIVPPGCHLSAVEILRRQFFAYLLDLAVDERLPSQDGYVRALPRKTPSLFGPDGYLSDLLDATTIDPAGYADRFLALFPSGVSDLAAAALRDYATGGLRDALAQAEAAWRDRQAVLLERLGQIGQAREALSVSDPDDAKQDAELDAERRAVSSRLRHIGDAGAHETLVELGLLPNYALIDTTTRLEATLYWEAGVDEQTGRSTYKADLREYERARSLAITELAPGNEFYVNGYKHAITGVEIGTTSRPGWQAWRVCPGCGYVRTHNAVDDRTPCPRCHSTHILDDGCLFNVVEPTLVTSRDKRDDARISDDADERTPRFHETVTAVDIAAEDIEPGSSWRHTTQVFGVDFTRRAHVRRLNLGPARFDTPPRDQFAGFTVRLNPFHVCTGCGAATAEGRPVFDHDSDALSSSAARDPRLKHHRPWCPVRRGRKTGVETLPVLLAHHLETEAVRVLLPAATVLVTERVYSLRAALRLGVDRAFGGDPAHIEATVAFMADQATNEQRCFLVLYDALPGGTGYLHRLADPAEFEKVLIHARAALIECPCAAEGRRACHRCLHRYTPDSKQDIVDRREALDVIDRLLERWQTTAVADTRAIGLDAQVESDLEARFLDALRAWAGRTEGVMLEEDGRRSAQLRIAAPLSSEASASADQPGATWRLTAQYNAGDTRPDFTFQRIDGPAQSVHIYLDGARWHASAECNRLASDAASRTRLRAEGHVVFQLTWDDLDLFEGRDRAQPVWPPYPGGAQETAKTVHQRVGGGDAASLAEEIWTNPLNTLLAYLRDPDPQRWARRAGSAAVGLVRTPAMRGGPVPHRDVPDAIRAALTGRSPETGGKSPVNVIAGVDDHGLPLVLAVDNSDPGNPLWTVLAVLDDDPGALGSPEHKRRWRAWLYWSNLVQFLSRRGGDGVQLTSSQASGYPVETLAVCGGVGELDSLVVPAAQAGSAAERQLIESLAADGVGARDTAWDTDVLPLLDEDEPGLLSLARALAEAGVPAPEAGYELGSGAYLAEMAWRHHRLAIVLAPHGADDHEAARRDAAYAEAGWTTRTAPQWHEHLDTLMERLIDAPGAAEGAAR